MSKVIRTGTTEARFSVNQREFFTAFLRKIAPETADILEATVEDLERDAKKQWPVRMQRRDRSEEERIAVAQQALKLQREGYTRQRAQAAANDMLRRGRLDVTRLTEEQRQELRESRSKRSIDRFETNIRISPSGMVEASVSNTASYAWAIKMGLDSRTAGGGPIFLPLGSRVSNELLWKPAKKQAKKIATVVADEITKKIGEG